MNHSARGTSKSTWTDAPPFQPFETEAQLITLVRSVFSAVDPRFAEEFGVLESHKMLDLMSRKGKAPGGYQYSIEDVRLPFIFANSVGTHQDVQTMLHEGGHAFHSLLSRGEDLRAYRSSPIEFAETASMSMELMGLEHLAEVYDAEDARVMYRQHLRGILRILPWIVSIDAFQRRIYAEPELSKEARRELWVSLRAELAPGIDWTGLEDVRDHDWLRQSHLFTHALYYVEYGIAQLAALQIWQRYRKDPKDAVERYRNALALGGSRPLPELFAAAGVKFDLSAEMLTALVADIESAIAEA